ncbi:hypothetical protein AMTRI_Chr10g232110 [Amborella trichopoda]|uniref:C2 domain-containing protein n=2 Tax=Amborella trichopoda TaxID=13333 RepID=U5DAK3_AMBTC|nr:protein C2-DOMAIN ABA-RELATED 11 isoform X2 [Amborella trichopoda]XP_011628281.1 protein C2-DOMAIN ABA-RELATED 11 isoform X2 [Amborella trichopoda]ERN19255.1 hypothetical protein AMTR_s00061p00212500 [Amborella trichopoda]|eukprot:XP_011628280.1 protein C2-DOMAIN ABA-RELATED 11 isoform X2 [Amborella trichopoda]
MGEAIGRLKVTVVRGKLLVVRDFTSSDPYVVVKLGNQMAKTKVINSCLNPVWNEELNFLVYNPIGTLKLEVFDKDRFKADDKMGNSHVDLQPLAMAARMRKVVKGEPGMETKMRKVVPNKENCLVRDSCVRYVDGEVVQDVCLRLRDVESGELDLQLKWVDVTSLSNMPSESV